MSFSLSLSLSLFLSFFFLNTGPISRSIARIPFGSAAIENVDCDDI